MNPRQNKIESHWKNLSYDELTKEELYYRVYHDEVTNSHNWNYMWRVFDERKLLETEDYCFVHFDIKGTKFLNLSHGHDAVNELLCAICDQMESEKKAGWVLEYCRCDNDNFAMFIKYMEQDEIVQKLTSMFNTVSVMPSDFKCRVFYRAGVVVARDALRTDDRVADFAKSAQRVGQTFKQHDINFYTSEMYDKLLKGSEYLNRLDEAILNDEFIPWFQPKFDIHSEKIVGAEALVRWNYKHDHLVFPGDFIPIFEENYVVNKVDKVILRKTCQALASMRDMGLPLLTVSVNLSRSCLNRDNLVMELCQVVDSFRIPHDKIDFELTESAAYADVDSMFKLLAELRSLGFAVSMDDFGTGYSSLSLLKDMPMDTLKIDKSFVDSIAVSEYDARENILVRDIINMAKNLGFVCLAEGAEEKDQVDFLRRAGCDKIQGYYYSKPVPFEQYVELIKKQA